jgi:hypothetical protein
LKVEWDTTRGIYWWDFHILWLGASSTVLSLKAETQM